MQRNAMCLNPNLALSVKIIYNAPINLKPAGGGGGGGRQGIGWGFDIFQKFAVKFPARGQTIPVKCTKISPPWAAHCCQISPGRTQERCKENRSK